MGKPKVWIRTRGKSILVFWEKLPEIQREQKSFKRDREAAEEFAAGKRLELRAVGPLSTIDRNVSVRAYSALWMAELEKAASKPGNGLKHHTLRCYRLQITKICPPPGSPDYPGLGEHRLRDVNQNHVESFMSDALRSKAAFGTVQLLYRVLRRMFQRAKHQGIVPVNCVAGVWTEIPGVKAQQKTSHANKRRKALDFGELTAFIAATETAIISRPHRALWYTVAKTGLRLGEAIGLHLSDVYLDTSKLEIRRSLEAEGNDERTVADRLGSTKTRDPRTFKMSPDLVGFLTSYLPWRREEGLRRGWSQTWLFVDEDGGPINRSAARWSFLLVAKAAGIAGKYSAHGLRHSYASHNLMNGAPLLWVAKQLGHSPELCLRTYAWAMPDDDHEWSSLIDGTKGGQAAPKVRSSSEQFRP